jgi:DNA-binding transcriptional regulator GbsR (MarR family)
MNGIEDKLHYIEEYGVCMETSGLPRMAGRIVGLLLICTPPHQAADQIASILDASKGTVSTMTRLLMQLGLIEKLGLPGERRDYFRLRQDLWEQMLALQLAELTQMRDLAERGLALLDGASPAEQERLREMYELHAFFEREMPVLLERYKKERVENRESRFEIRE